MTEEWISTAEAARILREKSGRQHSSAFVRWLIGHGKLTVKRLDDRTNLVLRSDVEQYRVRRYQSKQEGE